MTYPQVTFLGGQDLKDAFSAACISLDKHRDAVNALNVFPVPDGDTGTNMLLTMRAAVEKASQVPGAGNSAAGTATVAGFTSQLADGAFWGARGNSGIILSQFFGGIADSLKPVEFCAARDLERAFRDGARSAYKSVGNPVEGTMLTVMGALSPAVRRLTAQGEENPIVLWEAAFGAALNALESTPTLLPILKEAGVVDAGGLGMVVILGGALDYLAGVSRLDSLVANFESAVPAHQSLAGQPQSGDLGFDIHATWGFCIQFVIQGTGLEPERIRARFGSMESLSAVVAGNENRVRLHLHAADPEPVLAYGRSLGQLHQVAVQNMDQQNHEFVMNAGSRGGPQAEIAVVAVASGDGLAGVFRDAGCAAVISGGQTMNPSVQQLLESAGNARSKQIILLPNNVNVLAAAHQAATSDSRLHVVPSRSIPQGIAALLAFNPENALPENLDAMGQALLGVTSVEITTAVRNTSFGGLSVRKGQCVALTDGELAAAAESPEQALQAALEQIGLAAGALVTLYLGHQSNRRDAEVLAGQLQQEYPGIQVDLIYGGQPHYHYLASVE